MPRKPTVAVVGAGVSGLTCGVVLQESGYDVTLFAAEIRNTTSAVAAAIWYPYHIEPREQAERWALASYREFQKLAGQPRTGVSMVWFEVLDSTRRRMPRWSRSMPRRTLSPDEASPYPFGFAIQVPLIETPLYLPWLRERLRGRIHRRTIRDLAVLERDFDVVVNCAGIGARELCDDRRLRPGRGVVLKTPNSGIARHVVAKEGKTLTYVVSRKRDIILGGTDDCRNDRDVEPALAQAIHARCTAVDANLPAQFEIAVGFRPLRNPVRLERERGTRIIHNYGHGGAGFTVSWGCAREVLRRLRSFTPSG